MMGEELDTAIGELCNAADLRPAIPHDTTRVAVFGVWNSGKSTLIKRLLVELGKPIPDWLTVAGAPETNFVSTVSIDQETDLVDTPGISDGMSLHAGEAAEALKDADVVVVLLLPNLVTAEKDEILAVLNAEHVHSDGWPWPAHGIKVLVGQVDEFGLDPIDDEHAFAKFAETKLHELTQILNESGVHLSEPPSVVIADLGADVGDDREDVQLSDYERGDWDGIAGVLAWLRGIPHTAVREAGATRRLVADAAARARTGREVAHALDLQRKTLQVEIDERREARDSLELQLADARNQLAADLEAFAASIYSGDLEAGEQALPSQQKQVIDDWLAKQRDWLADARVDFDSSTTLSLDQDSESPLSTLESLISSGRLSDSAILVLEQLFGADSGTLKEELSKLKDNGDYWNQADRLFRSETQAKVTKTVLVVAKVLPELVELADLIRTARADPTPAHERLVAGLRNKVRDANTVAVDEAEQALRDLVAAIRAPLDAEINRREELLGTVTGGRDEQADRAQSIDERIGAVRAATQRLGLAAG
jgi:hypothetical protein